MVRGLGSALSAPGLLAWLWLANLLVALPAAVVVMAALEKSIGPSLVHENLRTGFDPGWFAEFEGEAEGIAATFTPAAVLGAGGFLKNLDAWLSGRLFELFPGALALGALYALIWACLLGGVLERFCQLGSAYPLRRFLADGGEYFLRFLRLAVLSGVLYYLIYRLARWLFRRLEDLTRDATSETVILAWVLGASALVALCLTVVRMAFDYAKIATVLEKRRSMLGAALAGFRFVLARPLRTLGLVLGFAILGALALGLYAVLAPGAGQASAGAVLLAFLAGQALLVLKLLLRLSLLAGEMALYRSVEPAAGAVLGRAV